MNLMTMVQRFLLKLCFIPTRHAANQRNGQSRKGGVIGCLGNGNSYGKSMIKDIMGMLYNEIFGHTILGKDIMLYSLISRSYKDSRHASTS
jgi:hypothetical protein